MRAAATLALAGAVAALGACTPSFPSASEVTDLRVLAVAAEPPEAFVDLDGGTVQPVTVRVLSFDPVQHAPPSASGLICFPSANKLCKDPQIPVPLDGIDGGVAQFTVAPPAGVLVSALQDDKLKGLGGVRLQFDATIADGDPHGPVVGEKILLFSTVPQALANHSPQVARVQVTRASGATEVLQDGGVLQLARNEEVGITPVAGEGSAGAEEYDAQDLAGNTVHLREQLQYAFFATIGAEWNRDTADEPLPGIAAPADGLARLRAYVPGPGTLWIVVRDGRGGLSWITATFNAG